MGCCRESSGSPCSPNQLGSFWPRPNPCQNLLSLLPPMLASGTNESKATGPSKVELLRRASPTAESAPKRSCFLSVTKDRKHWRAQTSSGESIGTFTSEKAAGAALAKHLDVAQGVLHRKRVRITDIVGYVEKFKVLLDVYTDRDSSVAVMPDQTSAADAMQQWPLLSVCAPGLHFASLMGKMGPWWRGRNHVAESF